MDITDLNISNIYKNTIQTIIDIINEIIISIDNNNYNYNYNNIYKILFREERQFYIGIIFILLSFVIYFIDGVSL
jgi:uncharacterized membrane protein YukC